MKEPKEIHEDVLLFLENYKQQGWKTNDEIAVSEIKRMDKDSLTDLEWQETITPQYCGAQQRAVSNGQYRFKSKNGYGVFFVTHHSKPIFVGYDAT